MKTSILEDVARKLLTDEINLQEDCEDIPPWKGVAITIANEDDDDKKETSQEDKEDPFFMLAKGFKKCFKGKTKNKRIR